MKKIEPKLNVCPDCGTAAIIVERGTYFRMHMQNSKKTLLRTTIKTWGVLCANCPTSTHEKHKTRSAAIKSFNTFLPANKAITQ